LESIVDVRMNTSLLKPILDAIHFICKLRHLHETLLTVRKCCCSEDTFWKTHKMSVLAISPGVRFPKTLVQNDGNGHTVALPRKERVEGQIGDRTCHERTFIAPKICRPHRQTRQHILWWFEGTAYST
jgi:hypothetical protein